MIEVNLLPGAARRTTRRRSNLSLPRLERLRGIDRWGLFAAIALTAAVVFTGSLHLGAMNEREELNIEAERLRAEAVTLEQHAEEFRSFQARRDSIRQRLEIIQELDAGRYIWAHILDEVSRALPDYTWLTALAQIEGGTRPAFRITGRTGNLYSLTQFLADLEASPFIRGVKLTSTVLVVQGGRDVHEFMIDAGFQDPPPELIETVPLIVMDP